MRRCRSRRWSTCGGRSSRRRSRDDLQAILGGEAGDLVKLIPELRELGGDSTSQSAAEPEQEKHRLFQALLQPIVRLAREAPLLLIVEDLHWSDDTSLEFLQSVTRRMRDLPIVLLVTYRSDEVGRSLAHFLAELDRGRATVELSLNRLGRAEVARMIGAIFGAEDPPLPDLVTTLHELTDGNPFFIEEVLKSLAMSGQVVYRDGAWGQEMLSELQIPRSVHDAVQQRSARLDATTRNACSCYAAVAGRRFDLALLARVSGTSDTAMLASTKELISAQLVVEESEDRFAFRHALTQQAIYSGLLIRERRTLHREIAEAIREAGPDEVDARLGELAHHYFEAGEWEEAFEYSARVGELAQRLFSPAAAVGHFSRALAAVAAHDASTARVDLQRARACSRCGGRLRGGARRPRDGAPHHASGGRSQRRVARPPRPGLPMGDEGLRTRGRVLPEGARPRPRER